MALLLAASVVPAAAATDDSSQGSRAADSNVVEGSYIVVYESSAGGVAAETDRREDALGFHTTHRYRAALEGFSAELTPDQVSALQNDPEIDFINQDRWATASGEVPLAPGEPKPPTGVRRIKAGTKSTVREAAAQNVAVIDTGIDLDHPDLNAADGTDCVNPGTSAEDGNGHGTHVAGTIGAQNDGAGVTGVAPNTKVYAVRVLNNAGSGSFAQIICGIDWVTANAAAENIQVANMSLGGLLGTSQSPCPGTSDGMHLAICNSTDAGVTYVVAAGNSGWDFDFAANPDVPAAYPEVLTVTAVSDSDGKSGGNGPDPDCRSGEVDDREASFSNFAGTAGGRAHTIAGPGVCILSTWLAGGYNTISGTSMASPHLAGVVALCHQETGSPAGPCSSRTPAQVISYMRSKADDYNTGKPDYGFLHDPLHSPRGGEYYGFLPKPPK